MLCFALLLLLLPPFLCFIIARPTLLYSALLYFTLPLLYFCLYPAWLYLSFAFTSASALLYSCFTLLYFTLIYSTLLLLYFHFYFAFTFTFVSALLCFTLPRFYFYFCFCFPLIYSLALLCSSLLCFSLLLLLLLFLPLPYFTLLCFNCTFTFAPTLHYHTLLGPTLLYFTSPPLLLYFI